MPLPARVLQALLVAAPLLLLAVFAALGSVKPTAAWTWQDIAGEGGTALVAGAWAWVVLGSRPGGRVTRWLAIGLAAIMMGAWADCLDEFYVTTGALQSFKWIESATLPAGMLALTVGLWLWRQEQSVISEHLAKRERLFREHRAFDRITHVADAAYLRRQLVMESGAPESSPCALVLLDIGGVPEMVHIHGRAESDRALLAVAHLLLLNLRQRDLLCRYAGHRFAVLMPSTSQAEAQSRAEHLCRMVRALQHHTRSADVRVALQAHCACAQADHDAAALLECLNRQLDQATQAQPAPAAA